MESIRKAFSSFGMARPSHAHSPVKARGTAAAPDAEEEEDNSQLGLDEIEANGDLQMATDLAAPSQTFAEAQRNNTQPPAPIARMGASQSKEQINQETLRQNRELGRGNSKKVAQTPATRTSTGKLRDVSTARNNPAYKNPLQSSTQRRLPPQNGIRKSAYEIYEDDSPVRNEPPQAHWMDERQQFSPRKKDRQNGRKAPQSTAESSASATTKRTTRSTAAQENVEMNDGHEYEERYRDMFPPAIGFQDESGKEAVAGAEGGDVAEAEGAAVEDVRMEEEAAEPVDTVTTGKPQRAPRGRPKKQPASVEDTTTEKRKRGRPKKSSAETAQHTAQNTAEHNAQHNAEHNAQHNAQHARATRYCQADAPPKQLGQDESATRCSTRFRAADEAAVATNISPQASRTQIRSLQSPQKTRTPTQSAQSQQKTPKSKGPGSAVEDLRRRSGRLPNGQPGTQDDAEYQPNDANDEAAEGVDVYDQFPESTQRPLASHGIQIDRVRLEELEFGNDEASDSPESSPLQSRKRKAGAQGARANTSKKVARSSLFVTQDAPEEDEGDAAADQRRLYGQWPSFKQLFSRIDRIGRNVEGRDQEDRVFLDKNNVKQRDKDVRETLKLCSKAIGRYEFLQTHNGPMESHHDPMSVLVEISNRIDGLRGQNEDFPTNFGNQTKCKELYFYVIPELLRLVRASVLCYEAMDVGETKGNQITIPHLLTVKTMMGLILNLEQAAKTYKPRPPPNLHVVEPVRNDIIPPLRRIRTALAHEIQIHQEREADARLREQQADQCRIREEEEARREAKEAHAARLRDKWQRLHQERMLAEGGLMRAAKRAHLQIPDLYHIEVDHNGTPFEREEVFCSRVGPPPDLVDAAGRRQWSMVELGSLIDGLKEYAGEFVYERVFRRYCGQGRELNKYSVTEIVVVAAELKKKLSEAQKKSGGVEEWVKRIPVWVMDHRGSGQENEGGVDLGAEDEFGEVVE